MKIFSLNAVLLPIYINFFMPVTFRRKDVNVDFYSGHKQNSYFKFIILVSIVKKKHTLNTVIEKEITFLMCNLCVPF